MDLKAYEARQPAWGTPDSPTQYVDAPAIVYHLTSILSFSDISSAYDSLPGFTQ